MLSTRAERPVRKSRRSPRGRSRPRRPGGFHRGLGSRPAPIDVRSAGAWHGYASCHKARSFPGVTPLSPHAHSRSEPRPRSFADIGHGLIPRTQRPLTRSPPVMSPSVPGRPRPCLRPRRSARSWPCGRAALPRPWPCRAPHDDPVGAADVPLALPTSPDRALGPPVRRGHCLPAMILVSALGDTGARRRPSRSRSRSRCGGRAADPTRGSRTAFRPAHGGSGPRASCEARSPRRTTLPAKARAGSAPAPARPPDLMPRVAKSLKAWVRTRTPESARQATTG